MTTADDDYWWQQRLDDACFAQGQEHAAAGLEPQSVHPAYVDGYNYTKENGGTAAAPTRPEPPEGTGESTACVVVRSWLHD